MVPIGLPCDGVVEFQVRVRTESQAVMRPETGSFTHQVTDLPEECCDFEIVTAKTFDVDTTTDFADADPGDGTCEGTAENNGCSLRAAVMEAGAVFLASDESRFMTGSDLVIDGGYTAV